MAYDLKEAFKHLGVRAFGSFVLCFGLAAMGHASVATLSINAASVVSTFKPVQVFGTNTAFGAQTADYANTQPKIQAAGTYFMRYPGGSSSDVHHWNGTGSYVANVWTPSNSSFSSGHANTALYPGTNASDGNTATAWVSNPDTDFPNAQWAYINLGSQKTVNKVVLTWGTPYATSFQVQYWDPATGNQWAPYQDSAPHWLNSSAGTVVGTGGAQTVNFTAVNTQYVRILMTASSGGAGAAYALNEIVVFNGATQQSSNVNSGAQSHVTVSTCSVASSSQLPATFDFEQFMTYVHSFTPSASPIITINFGTGTPQEAAAWVHYANAVKGYGIKYWEIGNELGGDWETGGPLSAKDYGRRFIEFVQAMKAEDPSIVCVGPVMGFSWSSVDWDGRDYNEGFIKRLIADPGGDKTALIGGIATHQYGPYNSNVDAALLSSVSSIPTFATGLNTWLSGTAAAGCPVFLTEYNANSNATVISVRPVNALFTVHWLGQWIQTFGSRANANFFALDGAGYQGFDSTQGSFGLIDTPSGPYQYQEFSPYWAMRQMAANWAVPGDAALNQLVSTTSTAPALVGYSDLRPDGILSLIVSNEDSVNTFNATINIAGYTPISTASTWTFDSTTYQWNTSATPYHATPDLPPTTGVQSGVGASFAHSFAPYSITVFQFQPLQTPTPTPTGTLPTSTPTRTQTPTSTYSNTAIPTPTACVTKLLYNGEPGGANRNLASSGSYPVYSTYVEDTTAVHGGTKGWDVHFSWSGTFYSAAALNFANYSNAQNFDASTYDNLEFWAKNVTGTVTGMNVVLGDAAGAVNSVYVPVGYYLPSGINNTWQKVSIPLSAFTGADLSTMGIIVFNIGNSPSGDATVYFDDIAFTKNCATSTPTLTFTATKTATPTPTATVATCSKRLGAFYPYWDPTYRAPQIPYSQLTHIFHAFVQANSDGTITLPASYVEPALIANAHAAGVKVLASVGGGGAAATNAYIALASAAGTRTTFANALVNLCQTYGYDGVDIDWELLANATQGSNCTLLMQAIRTAFNAAPAPGPTWELTMDITGTNYWAQWWNFAALNGIVTSYNVMAYDMAGSWNDHTNYNAALTLGTDPYADVSCQTYLNYLLTTRGIPASLLTMGLPFYGYQFPTQTAPYASCGVSCSDATYATYSAVAPLIGAGWTRTWDAAAQVPYLTANSGTGFITYDDAQSIDLKVAYALSTRNVGGVFIYDLPSGFMNPGQPLMDAAYNAWLAICGGTPTTTPTASSTRTFTASRTPSPTPSATRTASPSATPTPSPSATRSATASVTPSATPSFSATISPTPSATLTFTDVPPGSTLTNTPQDTATATMTETATLSPSTTQSDTALPSATPSASPTATPVVAAASSTPSVTLASTATPTSSTTATRTATPSNTPAAGPPATATSTDTVTPVNSAVVGSGILAVLDLVAVPNPGPNSVAIQMASAADEVELKVYSVAESCLAKVKVANVPAGWSQVILPAVWSSAAPVGLYYLRATASRGSLHSAPSKTVKCYVIR